MKLQAVSHPRGLKSSLAPSLTSCLTSALTISLALANPLAPAQTPPPAAHAPSQPHPATATTTPLPPFSGTWALDLAHSTIQGQRPPGSSQVVILYDGRTWRYRHIHSNNYGQVSDDWDTTLTVGAKTLHVAREEPLTFRSRIYVEKARPQKSTPEKASLQKSRPAPPKPAPARLENASPDPNTLEPGSQPKLAPGPATPPQAATPANEHPFDTVVLQEFVLTDRGGRARNTVRYSLEDGGATLIETEKSSGPMGTETNRWVLHRQSPGTAPPPIDRKDKDD
jgi:hypothetical protein